jgi:hypothetical protein
MQTPAGKECPHYYADFHRGRNRQECRLVKQNPDSMSWRPSDCYRCPVPDILRANASEDLRLRLTLSPRLLGLGRRLTVAAYCQKHGISIEDPHVGCSQCLAENPGLEAFRRAFDETEADD